MGNNPETTPRWMRDLHRFLPLRSQFVLWGNIRDQFAWFEEDKVQSIPLPEYLAAHMAREGIPHFLSYAVQEGVRCISSPFSTEEAEEAFFKKACGLEWSENKKTIPMSPAGFFELLDEISRNPEEPIGVAVDISSRIALNMTDMSKEHAEHVLFTKSLLMSLRSQPLRSVGLEPPKPRFNTIFWLQDREGDLPEWLVLDNPRLRSIPVPLPDAPMRTAYAQALLKNRGVPQEVQKDFVRQTDGMHLRDMMGIVQLCGAENLPIKELPEGAIRYKLGVTEDPWKRIDREKIKNANETVKRRVIGQDRAVTAMLDIVKKAVLGVSGTGRGSNRPRGVAFLAGPTGTGKTELAKTITELLFGDEKAYIRFDMSEFSAEHSDQRLLGAPPGYVGYDSGGELTNAIRERPFSVVLFDEIEKAHPRILDKFLQILDDGVLTSGRGERVYFSESIIIFTSNLGIYRIGPDHTRILNVKPEDNYSTVESRVRAEIENFFKLQLGRPEILNRLGENILVFDFIRTDVGREIFDLMLSQILGALESDMDLHLAISESARESLATVCLEDLSHGGRGIRNQLEARLVNPLARVMFDRGMATGGRGIITAVASGQNLPEVELEIQ
jgi:hypothetical protein